MVASRATWGPDLALTMGAGVKIAAVENVKTAAGDTELFGGLRCRQCPLAKGLENMTNERTGMPVEELLILFRTEDRNRRSRPSGQSFRSSSLRSDFPQRLAGGPMPLALLHIFVLLC